MEIKGSRENYDFSEGHFNTEPSGQEGAETRAKDALVEFYQAFKSRLFPELQAIAKENIDPGRKRAMLMLKVSELQDLRDAMSSQIGKLVIKGGFTSQIMEVEAAVKIYNTVLDSLKVEDSE